MKIGIISDTHLSKPIAALEEAVEKYFHSAELILHAGDVCRSEVLEAFHESKVLAVRGNRDSPEIRNRLPDKRTIRIGDFKIGLIHGWGSPVGLVRRVKARFKDVDCIVFGHSHISVNRSEGGVLMFNPGSFKRGIVPPRRRNIGILEIDNQLKGTLIRLR